MLYYFGTYVSSGGPRGSLEEMQKFVYNRKVSRKEYYGTT